MQKISADTLIVNAREAQNQIKCWNQHKVDMAVAAAAWAILEPDRNSRLAHEACSATGLGSVEDKKTKNYRKTLGLLRDLHGVKTVGVIEENQAHGIIEIARPIGVVLAITPSTNPAATPANNVMNALKCRNAVILAPSPKGYSTSLLYLEFLLEEFRRAGIPENLVQVAEPNRDLLSELMFRVDSIVVTGSAKNVNMAYQSGTPTRGVGVGNVASIILPQPDYKETVKRIVISKTFDNATSCSSENSLIIVGNDIKDVRDAFQKDNVVFLNPLEKEALKKYMFDNGKLRAQIVGKNASLIARQAGLCDVKFNDARILAVDETGVGIDHPFSGEKLSPVLAVYRVNNLEAAIDLCKKIYEYQGQGHSVGVHGATDEQLIKIASEIPACRVIADQVHVQAAGGSFDNGLPFSLSLGCGTWGKNSFGENLTYKHFMNIVRIVKKIRTVTPSPEDFLRDYWEHVGIRVQSNESI